MPFNHNAARRYRIPKARYRMTNWPAYEVGLKQRGDVTFWLDQAALAGHGCMMHQKLQGLATMDFLT